MIGSRSLNFVFIKTVKTAGTSVELILSSWCSAEDICTPISADDEVLRRDLGGSPRNFSDSHEFEERYRAAIGTGDVEKIGNLLRAGKESFRFFNHMSASEISGKLPDFWPSAFKFTVERHPYETAVSQAYFRFFASGRTDESEFPSFLERTVHKGDYSNFHRYSIDGKIAVDEVVLYPDIWPFMARLAERYGRSLPTPLPRAKSQFRKNRRAASEILSEDQKKVIQRVAEAEFSHFRFAP